MKWYDVFANFYDASLEKLYFASRQRAVDLLDLTGDKTVLDVACGTGANFAHIRRRHATAPIYGTDYSAGMLRRARANVAKHAWENIHLFQADARKPSPDFIQQQFSSVPPFDNVICALGLSVIPDWESVLSNLLNLLKPSGRLIIIDVFAETRDFNTWLVERIAGADLNRPIWQTAAKLTTDFRVEKQFVKPSKVGGQLFVAVGTKPQIEVKE